MEKFEKYIDNPKQNILEKSKVEQRELSDEKLMTITNREFLAISTDKRLQYITKNNIKSEDLTKEKLRITNLEFSFTFNWKFNRELWLKTTAWQVLPLEVREVVNNWIIYKRAWLEWEFFTEDNRRLIINEWTKLNDIKIWDISEIKKQDNKKIKEYLKEILLQILLFWSFEKNLKIYPYFQLKEKFC